MNSSDTEGEDSMPSVSAVELEVELLKANTSSTENQPGEVGLELEEKESPDMGNTVGSQKSWGSATIVEDDAESTALLSPSIPKGIEKNRSQDCEHDSGKDSGRGSSSLYMSPVNSGSCINLEVESPESFKLTCDDSQGRKDKDKEMSAKNTEEESVFPFQQKDEQENQEKEEIRPGNSDMVKLEAPFLLTNLIESDTPPDMYISCKGGKIGAHRFVLAAASQFLAELLQDIPAGEPAVIILPDISGKIVEIIICFMYTGRMLFPELLQDEVYKLMSMLMIGENARFSMTKVKVKPKMIPVPTHVASAAVHESSVSQTSNLKSSDNQETVQETSQKNTLSVSDSEDEDLFQPKLKKSNKKPGSFVKPKQIPGIGCVLKDGVHRCAFCQDTRTSRKSLCRHVELTHKKCYITRQLSPDEKVQLLYCAYCNKKYESLSKIQNCLAEHNQHRCYICLGVFPINEFLYHMLKAHSVNTEYGPLAQCRWCNTSLEVTGSGLAMSRHVVGKHGAGIGSTQKVNHEEQCKKPLAPIFTSLMKKAVSHGNVPTTSPAKSRPKRSLQDMQPPSPPRANKRPKLDENGKPIYFSKRTGVPVGPRKPIVDPSQKFHRGVKKIERENFSSKHLQNGTICNLHAVQVHLQPLKREEIDRFLNGIKSKELNLPQDESSKCAMTGEQKQTHNLLEGNQVKPMDIAKRKLADVVVPFSNRQCTEAITKNFESTMKTLEIIKQQEVTGTVLANL